jgi:hypothetical protein
MNGANTSATTNESGAQGSCGPGFNILQALPIGSAERRALEQQGFVAAEYRDGKGPYFKLKFRVAGRQRVLYLGADATFVDRIRRELAQLQAARRADRKLARLTKEAHGVVRRSKQQLEMHLRRAGLKFHGRAIRRSKDDLGTTTAQDGPAGLLSMSPNSREGICDGD